MDAHLCCYKLGKYFPEIYTKDISDVHTCLVELFHISPEKLVYLTEILHDIQQVQVLQEIPKIPQRSKEWFDLRLNRLTASDLGQALGKGKFGNRKSLLQKKAFPDMFPFKTAPALKWGTMFEDMGMRCYQQLINPVEIYEFGMIPNLEIPCFGASPDGITETGIMVEMKCPYVRKCDETIPEQYYLQIQGQLATCKLFCCDYVECYYEVYHDVSEYQLLCQSLDKKEHGIILEFQKEETYMYEYSPIWYTTEECIQWANQHVSTVLEEHPEYAFVKMTPWKLKRIFTKRVQFDEDLWKTIVPSIYDFWKDVEELRSKGLPEPTEPTVKRNHTLHLVDPDPPKKYRFIEDSDEES
jgi:putative phage-type endonuclease